MPRDIPDNSMAVGNPAKIIRTGIKVSKGKIVDYGERIDQKQTI